MCLYLPDSKKLWSQRSSYLRFLLTAVFFFFFADTRVTRFFAATFLAADFFVALFRAGFFADRLTAALPIFTTSSFNCVVFATMTPAVVPTVRANDVNTPSFLVSILNKPPSKIL
jgi:hypothetical protein